MPRVVLLRAASPETDASPELRYLDSWVRWQVRETFGEPRVVEFPEDGALPLAPGDLALLVRSHRALVARPTLTALARELDLGAAVAVPHRLADTLGAGGRPVRTLRGFEWAEAAVLASPPPSPPAPSLLPVSLLTAEAAAGLLRGRPPSALVGIPLGFAETGLAVGRAGLCHEFVDYYGEVRDDVLPHLPSGVERVLEIGCARGATGHLLEERLGCRVTGVELNPVVAREAARHLSEVIQGDVEDLELPGRYDAVLALELFEHLADPERFLSRVAGLVRPGGRIILSVPNVGHHAVVEDLLAGRWDYLPIGLLCYTHLRFFTRHTLTEWLRRLGFTRFSLIPQTTEEWPLVGRLPADLELDRESLRTSGFWVLIDL